MAKGKIGDHDLISEGALKTWDDLINLLAKAQGQLAELIKLGPAVDKSLKASANVATVSKNIDTIVKSIEKLIDAQKKLDKANGSISSLNRDRIQKEKQVQKELEATRKKTELLNAEYDKFARKVNQIKTSNNTLSNSFGNLMKSVGSFILAYTGFNSIMNTFGSIVKNTKELNSLDFSIKTIITDEIEFAQTQEYLNGIIKNFGLDLFDTTRSYIKFRAAVGSSNLTVEDGQKIFESIAKASATLGLTQEKTNLVFLALEQMLSKGTISSEELRRQLGEQMPVAMTAMAKAFGIVNKSSDGSVASLMKFMKEGKVISEEVLPEFARQVEKALGIEQVTKVDTLVAAQNKLNTSWTEFVKVLNISEPLIKAYATLADAMGRITNLITPEELKITKQSTQLISTAVGRLKDEEDIEVRRKKLMKEYNDLLLIRGAIQKQIVSEESDILGSSVKKIPIVGGVFEDMLRSNTLFLEQIQRGLGLPEAFWSNLSKEDQIKAAKTMEKAYTEAINKLKDNWESFVALPEKKEIPRKTEDTWRKDLKNFRNGLDAEYNAYRESQESLMLLAYNKRRDEGASEIDLERTQQGLQMDLDNNLFNFRVGQMDKLLEYTKSHEEDRVAVEEYVSDLKADIAKKNTDFSIKEGEREYNEFQRNQKRIKDEELANIESSMQNSLRLLDESTAGKMRASGPLLWDIISEQDMIARLEITKTGLEKMLEIENQTADEIASIRKNLYDTTQALEQAQVDQYKRRTEERIEFEKASFELGVKAVSETFSIIKGFQDARMQQIEWDYDREKNLAGENVAKKIAAENKYNLEKRKLQRRQAILEKAQGAFSVIIDTTKGIMDAASKVVTIPLIPFIAGLGAVSLASILAQPIPNYEHGGEHEGGIARFSEKGQELFIPHSTGIPELTPPKETVANMPKGTFVPHDETQRMLAQNAMNNFIEQGSFVDLALTNSILTKIANKDEIKIQKGYKISKKNNIFGKYATRD